MPLCSLNPSALIKGRSLLLFILSWAVLHCIQFTREPPFYSLSLPTEYISQKRIVLQGFSVVATPHGDINCIYFGYDRDGTHVVLPNSTNVAVDLIEFKLLHQDRSWKWEPIIVVSDDDFDGYADRLFVDKDLDGVLENIYDITKIKVLMDEKIFEEIDPWSGDQKPVLGF